MTICQRLATEADEPFLRKLILDSVTEELMAWSWPEPMRSHLLEIQYSSRRQSIRARFPNAEDKIVVVDSIPSGWFAKAALDDEIRWIDLIIAANQRGKGFGNGCSDGRDRRIEPRAQARQVLRKRYECWSNVPL